ncbi:MAG: hypothetical protein FWE43_03695 [Streptococcaceae bacterium]|nr:hypothetical protein [Streptococcaceae bacterium]MCL2681569.1 hypothetical protein [Streptococcaceae bacterium]
MTLTKSNLKEQSSKIEEQISQETKRKLELERIASEKELQSDIDCYNEFYCSKSYSLSSIQKIIDLYSKACYKSMIPLLNRSSLFQASLFISFSYSTISIFILTFLINFFFTKPSDYLYIPISVLLNIPMYITTASMPFTGYVIFLWYKKRLISDLAVKKTIIDYLIEEGYRND